MSTVSSNAGKAVRSAKRFARSAARTTKRLGRIAKLNMDIAAERDAAKRLYTEIGRLYYEAHRDEPEGFFVQLFQKIDASMETIALKEAELAALKAETKKPPHAGTDAREDETDPDITVEIEQEPEDSEPDDSEPVPAPDDAVRVEIESPEETPPSEDPTES